MPGTQDMLGNGVKWWTACLGNARVIKGRLAREGRGVASLHREAATAPPRATAVTSTTPVHLGVVGVLTLSSMS
jgi:hypothetical protein